jgi:hypothetical protein
MHRFLPLSVVEKYEPLAKAQGVSTVARSARGFLTAYKRAGSAGNLAPEWHAKREAFIKRHMAQVSMRKEDLFDEEGEPSRRHLALIMWAYSPGLRAARRNPAGPNELFDELVAHVQSQYPDFICELHCNDKKALDGRTSKRAHAACDARSGESIYVAHKIYDADYNRYAAILMHELAHALLIQAGDEDHSEQDADDVAEELFGHRISYDKDDVQTLKKGTYPRPRHLK